MTNLETEKEIKDDTASELDRINLTEWLIFKIKIIYGRSIFEGDTPEEASAIRQEWQDMGDLSASLCDMPRMIL